MRFAQQYFLIHSEDSLSASFSDVDVNRNMVVAVKKESVSILRKNVRH